MARRRAMISIMKKWISGVLVVIFAAMPVLACCCPPEQASSSHQHSAAMQTGDGHASHEHENVDLSAAEDYQDCEESCKEALQAASFTIPDFLLPKIKTDFQLDLTDVVSTKFELVEFYLPDRNSWRLYRADNPVQSSLPIFLATNRLRI